MAYVIACGDEGVQVNEGRRLAFAGSGFRLDGFSEVVVLLKQLFGEDIRIAANEENDWIKSKLDLVNWEQVNASTQQHIQALADLENLLYAGYFPFTDPKQLAHDIKGHMVRPKGVHIANKISFTLGGGEQKYNLGNYLISADWAHLADHDLIKKVVTPQIEFYKSLAKGGPITYVFEGEGELGEETAEKNHQALVNSGVLE